MIVELFVGNFVNLMTSILSPFGFVFSDDTFSFLSTLVPYFRVFLFILPKNTVLGIFKFIITIQVFRIAVATLKLIVGLLPFY